MPFDLRSLSGDSQLSIPGLPISIPGLNADDLRDALFVSDEEEDGRILPDSIDQLPLSVAHEPANTASTTTNKKRKAHGVEKDDIAQVLGLRTKQRRKKSRKTGLDEELSRVMALANEAFMDGQFEDAVGHLLEVIKGSPRDTTAYTTLGLIYEELKEPKKALEFFQIAAHLSKNDLSLWKRAAGLCRKEGNLQQLAHCLDFVVRKSSDDEHLLARYELAKVHLELGDLQRAVDGFDWLTQHLPRNSSMLSDSAHQVAEQYFRVGQVGKAARLLESYLLPHLEALATVTPTSLDLNLVNILVELYIHLGKYSMGVDLISRVVALAPRITDFPDSVPIDLKVKRAICQLHMGLRDEAEEIFRELCDENVYPLETYGDLLLDVAKALSQNDCMERVLELISPLQAVEQYHAPVLWLLKAQALQETAQSREERQEAKRLYELVLEEEPENFEVRLALSRLCHELGLAREVLDLIGANSRQDLPEPTAVLHASYVIRDEQTLQTQIQRVQVKLHQLEQASQLPPPQSSQLPGDRDVEGFSDSVLRMVESTLQLLLAGSLPGLEEFERELHRQGRLAAEELDPSDLELTGYHTVSSGRSNSSSNNAVESVGDPFSGLVPVSSSEIDLIQYHKKKRSTLLRRKFKPVPLVSLARKVVLGEKFLELVLLTCRYSLTHYCLGQNLVVFNI